MICASILLLACIPSQQGFDDDLGMSPTQTGRTQTVSLIDKTIWNPNLRSDSRGFLGTHGAPALDLSGVRLELAHHRYEYDGLRANTSGLDSQAVLGSGYGRVPNSAAIARTELRAEYGLSENATLRLNIPFESRRVSYLGLGGTTERHTSQGLADVRVSGSVELSFRDRLQAEFTAGLRVPTGATRSAQRNGGNVRLPYWQQLGGGSFAFEPGMRWTHWGNDWSFGAGASASLPLETNDQGWQLGDSLRAQAWASRRVDSFRSVVLALEYNKEDEISGSDPALDPTFDPSQDPGNTGGQKVSLNTGLHLEFQADHFVALEVGLPVWQDLNGPQLEEDFHFRLAWWTSF